MINTKKTKSHCDCKIQILYGVLGSNSYKVLMAIYMAFNLNWKSFIQSSNTRKIFTFLTYNMLRLNLFQSDIPSVNLDVFLRVDSMNIFF